MKEMYFVEWLWRTEQVISEAIGEILTRDWDENDATKSWMRAIRRHLPEVKIRDSSQPYAMKWDTLKLKGKSETLYGDIGIFVRIRYPNRIQIEGVGFIEAKRKYKSGRYDKLNQAQLKRMLRATPYHQLGLYSEEPIETMHFRRLWPFAVPSSPLVEPWNHIRAAVIPTPISLRMKGNQPIDLHPPSTPLSYQLCARYLAGYDLDFAPKAVKAVKDAGAGAPSYLLIADVIIGGETTPSPNNMVRIGPEGPYSAIDPGESEQGHTESTKRSTSRRSVDQKDRKVQRIQIRLQR